ncbi:hypothetical protein IHE45_07G083100 [Dioscorea alata]|uniref:Uncharacterized protein n=1 Tax=Dioscorea alata TaxID=55571 RepID=A0ACB7VSI1_DIOAL|nr:hypothetical protein IHE45_07G083100 [Dioscorea alata]
MNAEIWSTKARLMGKVPKLQRLVVKKGCSHKHATIVFETWNRVTRTMNDL